MIVDFQQHYTPPELLKGNRDAVSVLLDEHGNPSYLLNPLLSDLAAHVRMMDHAGIDAGVLTCGAGFDQPDLAICRLINDRMKQAADDYPGRFIGLAHVPALKPAEAAAEMKRCAVELELPGVVIGSELQGQALDCRGAAPVLARGRRSRSLRVHPSAAERHPLGAHVCRRSRPHARLAVLADGRGGAHDQQRAARRAADAERAVLAFRRPASAAISAASAASSSATSGAPPRCRGTAASRNCRSITISSSGCSTIAPAGPVPTMPASGAREWVRFGLQEVALSQTRVRDRLSAGGARSAGGRGLCRRGARARAECARHGRRRSTPRS